MDTTTVASRIAAYTAASGASSGSTPVQVSRHGITERNWLRGRQRERDRERGDRQSSAPAVSRAVPMGPQETVDWLEALDSVTNRIETIERALRLHSQSMAAEEDVKKRHRQYSVDISNDIAAYKLYIEETFKMISGHIDNKVGAVDQILHGPVTDNLNLLSQKTETVEAGVASLMAFCQRCVRQWTHWWARRCTELRHILQHRPS